MPLERPPLELNLRNILIIVLDFLHVVALENASFVLIKSIAMYFATVRYLSFMILQERKYVC